jgi:Cytochrome C oxidase, cbb3-type, subunit III
MNALKHPFAQASLLLIGAFVFFKFVIPLFPGSAPVPNSVVIQYTLIALVGILVFVSTDERRWQDFKRPIHATLVDPDKKVLRGALLTAVPLLVGFASYLQVRPTVGAAAQLRSIHPAPPGQITFQGQTINITGLENPLRREGSMEDHLTEGRRVYYQNCLPCHGDLLDGQGHFAHGFNPTPLAFGPGTIDQLQESFLFWRIAKGGVGLPVESTPWNSAMPAWENFLTQDEIWSVIIFLYDQNGLEPRRWEAAGSEGGGGDGD